MTGPYLIGDLAGSNGRQINRDALIEATVKALVDAETNGLCGSTWPGPCDMCDCGLEGMTMAEAAAGQSAARERARVEHVLSKVLPLIADAIEAEGRQVVQSFEPAAAGRPGSVEMGRLIGAEDAYKHAMRVVRSLLGTDSDR